MSNAAPFVDQLLRGRADRHKPTYRQLRDEGVTQPAIELLHEGRDMLEMRWTPYGFAQWLYDVGRAGIAAHDVWPHGRPNPTPADTRAELERMRVAQLRYQMGADWDQIQDRTSAEWDALEAELVAGWAADDAPAAHQVCAELYMEEAS